MKVFDEFVNVVKKLRAPGGCPWDRKQTIATLAPYVIEEAYELVDAIKENDMEHVKEELGDKLLHIIMIAVIAEEKGDFSLEEVVADIMAKMIRRHPHVFGDTKVNSIAEIWNNWEKIKKNEKNIEKNTSYLDTVPKTIPAVMEALNLQKKAGRMGFDWPDLKGVKNKIKEELSELDAELKAKNMDKQKVQEELGDLFFTFVNYARKLGFDAETTLKFANKKFRNRFFDMERQLEKSNDKFSDLNIEKLEELWQKVKLKS